MTAFADMLTTLHADPNIGEDAYFRRPPYAWEAVRITRERPTDAFGQARAGKLHVTILDADMTDTPPEREDEVMIGQTVYVVEDTERDSLGLSWLLTLADRN